MPDENDIDSRAPSNQRRAMFASALAPHLARELGGHSCLHFTPDEAASLKSLIRWSRIAIGAVITSAAMGVAGLVVALLSGG